jgi:hypothetical protein
MKVLSYFIGLVVAIGILLFIVERRFVWIPDVIISKLIILDSLTTTNGDHLQLTQRYVGDGYSTRFVHSNKVGRSWLFVIDGDAKKAWQGEIRKTNGIIAVSVLKHTFFYNIQSHMIRAGAGNPQLILELPEDGTSAFFLGKPSSAGTQE